MVHAIGKDRHPDLLCFCVVRTVIRAREGGYMGIIITTIGNYVIGEEDSICFLTAAYLGFHRSFFCLLLVLEKNG